LDASTSYLAYCPYFSGAIIYSYTGSRDGPTIGGGLICNAHSLPKSFQLGG
jgi:hypothetical protein